MPRHSSSLQSVETSAVPLIIPTLGGRVRGVLRSGAAAHSTAGLIVLLESEGNPATLRQLIARLAADCRTAGISVLEILHKSDSALPQSGDDRLALDVLAAVTHLRSQGIADVAVLLCLGAKSSVPVHTIEKQLFTQCLAASVELAATWYDASLRLTELTETIRSAVDSIRGLASIHTLLEEWPQPSPALSAEASGGNTAIPVMAASSVDIALEEERAAGEILHSWTIATLKPGAASRRAVTSPAASLASSASLGIPSRRQETAVPVAPFHFGVPLKEWHAEAAQMRTGMRRSLNYLQGQWDAMLKDLEKRDGERAAKVRALLADAALTGLSSVETHRHYDPTGALLAARLCWHLLDRTARYHWLQAWDQVCRSGVLQA